MQGRTDDSMYRLSDILDIEEASAIPAGSSILVSGPAMTGKDSFVLDILADGTRKEEGVVVMSTDTDAEKLVEAIQSRDPDVPGHRIAAMDCRSESGREETELDNGAFVHRVASPSDLTGIGIGVTKCFDRLHAAGIDRGRLALMSLSTMITYSDKETVFKFCHVLSSRLDAAEFLGLFTIDSTAHDEQTLQVIKQAVDGLIELRERDGVREARLGGLQPEPSDWVEL
ncbi:MAG: ATPase domain-containing protein [Halovenus sp.]